MLILYYLYLKKPLMLLLSYVLQVIPYFLLMKKLGLNPYLAFLPNVAEYQMSRKVFKKRRSFFRPFLIAAVLLGCALYVNPYKGVGILYVAAAFIVYGIFLARLYGKICIAFGKTGGFAFWAAILPPIFLTIVGKSAAEYTAPAFRPEKPCSKVVSIIKRVLFIVLSVVELLVLIAGCGFLAIRSNTPGFIISGQLDEIEDQLKDVQPTGALVTREDTLGTDLAAVTEKNQSRDYYFQDHSSDQSAVVFVYVIGSNLEDQGGLASANIRQMITATEQGSGLKFILETGGSARWFTRGIKNGSYGRYEIADGKITTLETLPADTNMADETVLADFLTWANANYSADRSMLVLWDHGGGVALGYGEDSLNGADSTLQVPDIANALAQSGMKFDIIGFDACLMQDIEVADAFAPYADYFIASEETEGGLGWCYTPAFSSLAKDPGMSSEEFGNQLIACYDPYNELIEEEVDTGATLSLIDLTMVESAYDQLSDFLDSTAKKIADDPECFADVSIAASNTYDFYSIQLDLIDFLNIVNKLDYDHTVASDEEIEELVQSIEASIVCRNGASASGINGISFAFPYNSITMYDSTYQNLKELSMGEEEHAFDVIFSIMAAQQKKSDDNLLDDMQSDNPLLSILTGLLGPTDYTQYDWYIEGFEDYDDAVQLINLPLIEQENGYQVDLPEKTWSIITDVQTMVYRKVENDANGAARCYIGNDYLGGTDENGHTMVAPDDCWPHIEGELVCYEADQVRITDDGEVYTGNVKALLNGNENITLKIEWNASEEGNPDTARILGYVSSDIDVTSEMPEKGYTQLQAGDRLQFLFDYYDAEGNFIETKAAGQAIRVSDPSRLAVTDEPLPVCTIEFGGMLKDVYQRVMTTEMVEVDIVDQ